MCRLSPEGEPAYCPLGLIALLSGADFRLEYGEDDMMCDDDGETLRPNDEVLEPLGLTAIMTEEELASCWEYRTAMQFYFEGEVLRWEALSFMNDQLGLKLEKIADEIERLEWDRR
jgi:hypothetical protein